MKMYCNSVHKFYLIEIQHVLKKGRTEGVKVFLAKENSNGSIYI